MHLRALLVSLALVLLVPSAGAAPPPPVETGDIVFQTSRSPASVAIQLATHSKYSHMGLVWRHDGRVDVIEAIDPVSVTPLASWIARGEGGHFVARRLHGPDAGLDPSRSAALIDAARREVGKPYDLAFAWSDARMYCSELVWKAYHRVGIDLGTPRPLRAFDLSDPRVRAMIKQRWGDTLPLDEPMISPGDVFEDPRLETVAER